MVVNTKSFMFLPPPLVGIQHVCKPARALRQHLARIVLKPELLSTFNLRLYEEQREKPETYCLLGLVFTTDGSATLTSYSESFCAANFGGRSSSDVVS